MRGGPQQFRAELLVQRDRTHEAADSSPVDGQPDRPGQRHWRSLAGDYPASEREDQLRMLPSKSPDRCAVGDDESVSDLG